ncbi:MAG: hypothetical protein GY906_18495 [bacterium]|nr:hypothetical protein [bacterium]
MRIRLSAVVVLALSGMIAGLQSCSFNSQSALDSSAAQPISNTASRLETSMIDAEYEPTPQGASRHNAQASSDFFYQQRFTPEQEDYPFHHLRTVLRDVEDREQRLRQMNTPIGGVGGIRNWTELGPGNIGGRTRALAIDPTTPDTMYAGGVAGGIWKSTDAGAHWYAVDDSMINLAISTIVINPADPRIIYAGTGEGYYWGGMVRGLGIFKSTDAGATWNQLEGTIDGVPDGAFDWVNDIVISPNDSERLYAATRYGVWRSPDAGESWTVVLGNPDYLQAEQSSRGCTLGSTELAIRTDSNPDVVFAAFGSTQQDGLYRTHDGGDTWQRMQVTNAAGQGRMALAIAPSNNNIMYVSMAQNYLGEWGKLLNVFRTDDGGDTWEARVDLQSETGPWLLSNLQIAVDCYDYPLYHQGWYDNVVAVDPADPEIVWVGGVFLLRSDDGGLTFLLGDGRVLNAQPGGDVSLHVDHHALVFHPDYDGVDNQIMFSANDGGIARTDRARARTTPDACTLNSFVTWRELNHGYAVTQFYHGDSAKDRDWFVGGTQDNGTNRVVRTDAPTSWRMIYWGDGGYVAINPTNSLEMYVEIQGFPEMLKSTNGGNSFSPCINGITDTDGLFISPFAMDQSDPSCLWTGGTRPWRTVDGAESWDPVGRATSRYGQISAIAIAPTDSDTVYLGYSTGGISRTSNGRSESPTWEFSSSSLPSAWVSSIAVDPTNPNIAYCTISTFGHPHVFRTLDGGDSWHPLNGIGVDWMPDIPAHWIAIRPSNPRQLYVATELGIFASDDGGDHWFPANFGFPHTVVESLDFKDDDTLVAFTHGRGVFLAELTDPMARRPGRKKGRAPRSP